VIAGDENCDNNTLRFDDDVLLLSSGDEAVVVVDGMLCDFNKAETCCESTEDDCEISLSLLDESDAFETTSSFSSSSTVASFSVVTVSSCDVLSL